MPSFHYVDNELYAEDVALTEIAREHGTPTYVYSKTDIENAYTAVSYTHLTLPTNREV